MDLGIEGLSAIAIGDDPRIADVCGAALTAEGARFAVWHDRPEPADIIIVTLNASPKIAIGDLDAEATVLIEAWRRVSTICIQIQSMLYEMMQRGFGRIIFIGPISAKTLDKDAVVDRTLGLGMLGLQKNLGGEYGESGITANSILYDDELEPDDALMKNIGAACAYLASRQAAYLTGVVMTVDAGRSRTMF